MKIYIDVDTGMMVNISAPYKGFADLLTPERQEAARVAAIEADELPAECVEHPDWYFVNEDWSATQRPYIIYTRKNDDQIKEIVNDQIWQQIERIESAALMSRQMRSFLLSQSRAFEQPWYPPVKAVDDAVNELKAKLIP